MNDHTNINLRQGRARTPRPALRTSRAFTLIELLVVISIIAILAALLLPAIARGKVQAMKKKAQLEVAQIAHGIQGYEGDYSKFPVSSVGADNAMASATKDNEDFTYGGIFPGPGGSTVSVAIPGLTYTNNNAEVMAVLLDVEYWPNTLATINKDHVKNPQKTRYLNPSMVTDTSSPGVGSDGVYRDPWGNPYIITVDLNYDDKARDAFYRRPEVSEDPTDANRGLNGLILKKDSNGQPVLVNGKRVFELNSPVMVWSAGPDKMIDPNTKANRGVNNDNILSWKQ
jgi:prepilin-type N-terminal cleavage/methylation domain-containing protein